MKLISPRQTLRITNSKSIITFETTGGGQWKVWDRYLCIDRKQAYHIGNICGTCSYFFERLGGANQKVSAEKLNAELKVGISWIEKNLLDEVSLIIPNDEYIVSLLEIKPNLVKLGSWNDYFANEEVDLWGIDSFWGLPHNPKIQYYRGTSSKVESNGIYEFIVPMFPQGWLDSDTVNEYLSSISLGNKPTAIALSILDVKEPADGYENKEITKHWCLTHYLIDGHHKIYAANESNESITLLSFLAVKQGISDSEDIEYLFSHFEEGTDF